MAPQKNYILDKTVVDRKLKRMALEIVEQNLDEEEIIIAGIKESGSVLAKHLKDILDKNGTIRSELISISLDKRKPAEVSLSKQLDFTNRVVVIVDDVANSGRTLLYAMKPFLEFHPKKIQTLVLVARSHKAYPVHADYVGLSIATTLQEHIYVEVENGVITGAYLN